MDLKVEWISATRVGQERTAVEVSYAERLLDLFGTAEAAAKAKEGWHRAYEPPIHPWTTYNRIAFMSATAGLHPCERHLAHFVVRFTNDPR